VFRIDPEGRGAMFFDSAELRPALALAPNGQLVGTSPDADPQSRRSNTSAFSRLTPVLGARRLPRATCSPRPATRVYHKITPDGKAAVFYKTNTTHVMTLTFDKAGNLLAGTGTPGKVLRIDAEGKAFLLLDSPFQEIRSLRFDDKGVLRGCAGRPGRSAVRQRSPTIGPNGQRNQHVRQFHPCRPDYVHLDR
jgi:hypothetical protein